MKTKLNDIFHMPCTSWHVISWCGLNAHDQCWSPMPNSWRPHVTLLPGIRHHSTASAEARHRFYLFLYLSIISESLVLSVWRSAHLGSNRRIRLKFKRWGSQAEGRARRREEKAFGITLPDRMRCGAPKLTAVTEKCEFLTLAVLISSNVAAHCSAPSPRAIGAPLTGGWEIKLIDQRPSDQSNGAVLKRTQVKIRP